MLHRPSRSRFLPLRGLRCHVREWGPVGAPMVVMLHGWMDVGASFQFVVDALGDGWHVLAPDWRGFGLSDPGPGDCYWFPDYLADLEALLDALAGAAPVHLLGHSMGGNVAMLYAGVRTTRVRTLVNLEGFGVRDAAPAEAPDRYARWLDELRRGFAMRDYASLTEVAERLQLNNPRLSLQRARFLAPHWSIATPQGRWRIAGDPAHKRSNPVLYRFAEVAACWQRIRCPVLWIEAAQTDAYRWAGGADEVERRRRLVPDLRHEVVAEAGHMVHHDQPEAVARMIAPFFAATAAPG
jgi:pimeloyl-ACP methyl ester carboxylesterase